MNDYRDPKAQESEQRWLDNYHAMQAHNYRMQYRTERLWLAIIVALIVTAFVALTIFAAFSLLSEPKTEPVTFKSSLHESRQELGFNRVF